MKMNKLDKLFHHYYIFTIKMHRFSFQFLPLLTIGLTSQLIAEPLLSSWYTEESGSYARIWASIADETLEKTSGTITSLTTWDAATINGPNIGDQPLPVYAGIQEVSYSTDTVYIKATGLGVHTMGPWYDDEDKTDAFPSLPGNAAILYSFPRNLLYPANYVSPQNISGLGTNGLMVDGVPIFNSSDGASYNDEGVWNQDAFFNEGRTFDSGNAHQAAEAYHYHASPAALRHHLGDSVNYDSTVVFTGLVSNGKNNPYTEAPNGQHSPILGWVNDGLPIYGPYGYSDPNDASSGVRRMVSGYQMRDGSNGSYDIPTNGRDLLPQWSVDLNAQINSTTPASDGPVIDTGRYRLGTFAEDYALKSDLTGFSQYNGTGTFDESVHFDLNAANVRFCVTPEYPEGTWAYFTSILADGTPFYPYNVASIYFGDNTAASGVAEIPATESITTLFSNPSTDQPPSLESIENNDSTVTITWNGMEGGIYEISASTDLDTWSTPTALTADSQKFTNQDTAELKKFYTISQTGLSAYDTTEFTTGGGGGPGGGGGGPGGGGPPQ